MSDVELDVARRDEAPEAEVFATSAGDLVEAVTARTTGEDSSGRQTFATTSPDWWIGGRTFGGMVVAQALSAAVQTVPSGLEVHSLHGYFLRPTGSRARTRPHGREGAGRPLVQHPGGRERRGR